jgi:hypothetical protein
MKVAENKSTFTWCTPLITTDNYSAIIGLHTLQFTITRTLVTSIFTSHILEMIYNSLTVTAAHIKSSSHSLIPFLPFLNHLRLPTPETRSTLILAAEKPRYIASGRNHRKHRFPTICLSLQRCFYLAIA